MNFLLEPNRVDASASDVFLALAMGGVQFLAREAPSKPTNAPPLEEVMSLDTMGWYMLRYNRPGSTNHAAGIAMDFAFRVGRQSLFGYALGRLISPVGREATHAF
jgi:hypothetical protein